VLEGARARAGPLERQPAHGSGDNLLGPARVLRQGGDDHVDGYVIVVRVPAVVVGDERDRRVTDLRFAREFGLLQVRHADDVHPPRSVEARLGQRGELGALHAHVGAAFVNLRGPVRRAGVLQSGRESRVERDAAEPPAERVREPDVGDEPPAEERRGAAARAIEELVRNEEVERAVGLLQASDGARREDELRSEGLEAEDVRPEVQLGRHEPVAGPVARQEGDPLPAKRSDHVRR
jgi:hypothetical protein